jgi:hypothetical protein
VLTLDCAQRLRGPIASRAVFICGFYTGLVGVENAPGYESIRILGGLLNYDLNMSVTGIRPALPATCPTLGLPLCPLHRAGNRRLRARKLPE